MADLSKIIDEALAAVVSGGLAGREGQVTMARAVAKTLNAGELLVVEGPTGTGKSLAYLIGAVAAARARKKTLVISTATIALQEQLLGSDIDLLNRLTGWKVVPALAKGRQRHVCDRRLAEIVDGPGDATLQLFEVPPSAAARVVARAMWKRRKMGSWNGDIDTWSEAPGPDVHAAITVPAKTCSGPGCAFFHNCAVYAARERVRKAEVVVANASLVLADLAGGGGLVLPDPEDCLYVFDEAHHLAEVARRQFEVSVPINLARRALRQLPSQVSGVARELDDVGASIDFASLQSRSVALQERLESAQLLLLQNAANDDPVLVDARDPGLSELMQVVKIDGGWLDDNVAAIMAKAREDRSEAGDAITNALGRASGLLESLARLGRLWCHAPDPDPIARWTQASLGEGNIVLNAAPVDASSLLRNRLWKVCAGAILTSATLRSLGRFDTLKRDVGLDQAVEELALASPFDLEHQGRFVIHPNACVPRDTVRHTRAIAEALPRLVEGCKGVLVLFGSYRQLEDVLGKLPAALQKRCLVQGKEPRHVLLETHRTRTGSGELSVLLGVQGFGEGLDLPGDQCVLVVIAKLPFVVPTEPVELARSRWLERKGRNPFMDDALPRAHRTLIQWCGRLIRSETDTGRIVIFDERLRSARWGRQMLETLPPFGTEA